MRDVRIYVEGGGNGAETKATLRIAFSDFLAPIRDQVRGRAQWHVIPCGGRRQAYDSFCHDLTKYPAALNILLVDSEGQLSLGTRWGHVARRRGDGWTQPPTAQEDNLHFMVVVMETWFLADTEILGSFYGKGFKVTKLPRQTDVERIEKAKVEVGLKAATKETAAGEYRKIKHGAAILKKLDSAKVRMKASHCDKLFHSLAQQLGIRA